MSFMRACILETLKITPEDEYKKCNIVYFLENPLEDLKCGTKAPHWDLRCLNRMNLILAFLNCFGNIKNSMLMIHYWNGA